MPKLVGLLKGEVRRLFREVFSEVCPLFVPYSHLFCVLSDGSRIRLGVSRTTVIRSSVPTCLTVRPESLTLSYLQKQ